jgi:hypothetical protein
MSLVKVTSQLIAQSFVTSPEQISPLVLLAVNTLSILILIWVSQFLLIYCCFDNVEVDFMRVTSAFTWKMIMILLANIYFELLVTMTCYDK